MLKALCALILVASVICGIVQPAESAAARDLEAFGQPTEQDLRFEQAAQWAGFYGPVRVTRSDNPRGMNGVFTDQVCFFIFMCMALPEPYIGITLAPTTTEEEAMFILFHEVAHSLQYRDWPANANYPASESDADLLGARMGVAYGLPLDAYRSLWQHEIEVLGDEVPKTKHPRNSMRIWHVLSQVPALPMSGGRSEAP